MHIFMTDAMKAQQRRKHGALAVSGSLNAADEL